MFAETSLPSHRAKPAATDEITSLPILILHVHENCNCKCRMCDIWKHPAGSELSLERVAAYQSSIRRLNVRHVVLTGGEPLLHSRFQELCQLIKQCDVRLTLLSTGLLLSKKAVEVAQMVDEIIVSLDGPEKVHNDIRRVPQAYRLLQEGIQKVRAERYNLPINVRSTVQRANFSYLRQTVAAARELQCDSISFLAVDTTSQAFNRELVWPGPLQAVIGLTKEDVRVLQHEMECLIEEYAAAMESWFILESPEKLRRIVAYFRQGLGELPPRSPVCNAPWVSSVIEVDGSVRPCFFQPRIGTVGDLPLHEAVNTATAREFRRTLDVATNPTCQRCVCSLNYHY